MKLPDYDPPYTVIMTTTWTCQDGHVERMSEDLGDPADREQVRRVEREIYWNGCRAQIGSGCCGKECKRETSERREYL